MMLNNLKGKMMETKKLKSKNIIKDSLIFIFIVIVCFSNIFVKSIGSLDEIWNYNFSKNIADGLVPYKDFNMLQMPLLSFLSAIVLKIFGNQLIIMRVLAVILMSAIFFITYKILKLITKSGLAELILIPILVLFKDIMCIDYNYAVLLIGLILVYIELKNSQKANFEYSFKYNFILGFIAGLAILCKQTTGLAVVMACAGGKIFTIRKKEEIKSFLKIAFTRILGSIIPVICFMLYLIINNAFSDFINYTILGISTFSNKISYDNLFKQNSIIISILAAVIPVTILFIFTMLFNKKILNELCILFVYSISTFIVTFPISDRIHFLTGSLVTILAIVYLIYKYGIENNLKKYKDKTKLTLYGIITFSTIFLILTIFVSSIENINQGYIKVEKENELAHFIGIPESKGLKERIQLIDEYIVDTNEEGKKVYILDAEAAIYDIPLDIYNKDYDMFLKGNFGADGEDGIIKRIEKENNAVYLLKMSNINWQNPDKVREYVIENLNYVGEILNFWIFEK